MKTYKNTGFGPRKSKGGFTLIELLIVMVILAILAGVVVMAVGGVFGTARSSAYTSVKDDLQNSVTGYATDHNGNFPFNTSTGSLGGLFACNSTSTSCYVLNFSAMMTSNGGMLREVPDGTFLNASGTASNPSDNCDASNPALGGCMAANHYTWGADTTGNVYSYCSNTSGNANGCTDLVHTGYMGVWP
jgi:prepilin-type N-terminal cleavage/methylation domain-containing protein